MGSVKCIVPCTDFAYRDDFTDANGLIYSTYSDSWGNRFLWGYDERMDQEIESVLHESISGGVRLVDTADSYGTGPLKGRAEILLGRGLRSRASRSESDSVIVATKLAPYPWRLSRHSIVAAVRESIDRMGGARDVIDIGQLHWSTANYLPFQDRQLWDGLADCYDQGLINAVGLSNYGPVQLKRACKQIREVRGVPVTLAQAQVNLLSTEPLKAGGLKCVCDDLGITLAGYSPLALGLLTGKYREGRLPKGPRSFLFRNLTPKISPVLDALRTIADSRPGSSMSQIAIAWVATKGCVPIPGANNLEHARSNVAAAAIELDDDEIMRLDGASQESREGHMVQNIFNTS